MEQFFTFSKIHWYIPAVRYFWGQVQLLTYCPPHQVVYANGNCSRSNNTSGLNDTDNVSNSNSNDESDSSYSVARHKVVLASRPYYSSELVREIFSSIQRELARPELRDRIKVAMSPFSRTTPLETAISKAAECFLPIWLNLFQAYGMKGEPSDIAAFQSAAYEYNDSDIVEMSWTVSRYGFLLYCKKIIEEE